ncbi:MAG: hypothetical protein IKN63_02600 [Bacilli bacterium]|nr:hypothetical protein [Bacilli bacterium]
MKKYISVIVISLLMVLTTGCKKNIIGKWKAIDTKNEYYYIFNVDKTCSYEMNVARLDCTYEIDDNKITILYKGNDKTNSFQYRFEGNNLIIKDDRGKDNKFTKIHRTMESK